MSKEIFLSFGTTGLTTLYASIRRPSDGFRWYTVTPAFEAYNSGHVAAGYAITMTEEGATGNYYADFPAGIVAAGRYEVTARKQAGGSPAWPADAVVGVQPDLDWSGSAIIVPVAGDTSGRAPVSVGTGAGQLNVSGGKTPATLAGADMSGNPPTDWLNAAAVKADAVTKIQAGLSTYAGGDTAGTTTLLARVPTFPANFAALSLTAGGKVGGVVLTDTVTTYTGDTPQTGDSFARLGVAGVGLTNLGDARLADLDAAVSSRSTFAGGAVASVTAPVTLAAGAIDIATYTPTLAQLAFRRLDVSGSTSDPVTADTYQVDGFYNSTVFYKSINLGTPVFIWYTGSAWVMSTVLGTAGLGSFQSSGTTVNAAYTAQGTAAGTPAVVAHGNSVLSAFQPDAAFPAVDGSGRVTLAPAGLDAVTVTEPTGPTSGYNFRQLLRWLQMRFENAARVPTSLVVKTRAGAMATTQAVADDGSGTESTGVTS